MNVASPIPVMLTMEYVPTQSQVIHALVPKAFCWVVIRDLVQVSLI